ncbi:MAG TPA: aminotransferase class I/II-fold pyridoxal phosphate-dependent enzyme [Chloroflexi bacterium]|jgi:aminotransferase|nr:aminotransferase class I/II-fold pyridoxal phosphate-dependent enzyme [Chloroflexota bacterium]
MTTRVSARVRSLPESGLRHFFDILATMDDVLSLGIGEPDMPTPRPVRAAAIAAIEQGQTGYTSNAGIRELRLAIAASLRRRYGLDYDPDEEILVTVGVSEALLAAMLALLDPGDAVLVPEPCFVAYDACVRLAGGEPIGVPTLAAEGFQVRVERLEAARTPRTRALLVGYPSNPTGAMWERAQAQAVAQWAAAHDLLLISDEIYDRFVYGVEHTCLAALPGMQARTLLLGGFSKSYAMTGWRVGYACGPRAIIAAMHKVHQYAIMSAPTPGQVAALHALSSAADPAEAIIHEFAARRDILLHGLRTIGLPCVEPRGAIYAFPSVAHLGCSATAFAERLLREERVAVVPGDAFGRSGEGHVRIAYTVSSSVLEEALERMARFVRRIGG